MIRLHVTCIALLVLASVARAQSVEELQQYTGYYELAGHHPVVVSFRFAPGGQPVLVYTDLKTDAIRGMFPAGEDRFRVGAELTRPEPVVAELRFGRSEGGAVSTLELAPEGRRAVAGERVPIGTETVRFERDGVEFEGTLFLPPGADRAPGAILALGSEDGGERHNLDAHPWVLARRGLAVLAYDKRGNGKSGGSWHVSLEVLARDAVSALALMREHARVDPGRLGIVGFSEGGWLAPLIARLDGGVAFIVAISGGGMTKADSFVEKHRRRFVEAGLSGGELESALAEKQAMMNASRAKVAAGEASAFDLRVSYDPEADWKRFDGAVLAVMGEVDVLQDSAACAEWLGRTLAASGSTDWEVELFPRAHHSMFLARTGEPAEFERMQGLGGYVPGYWATLVRWVDERF